MLAPGDAGDLTQVIDARDLAAFLLDGIHRGSGGVFNLTGTPRPFGILLDLCRTATYSDADLTWIPTERLVAAGVDPGTGIPLWVGEPGYEAFNDVDSSRAVGAGPGLPVRSPRRSATPSPGTWRRGGPEQEGLDPAEEARLLAELAG